MSWQWLLQERAQEVTGASFYCFFTVCEGHAGDYILSASFGFYKVAFTSCCMFFQVQVEHPEIGA